MGLVAKAFQDIITFSRNSNGTYVNSNGYITNSAVSNYLGYSNQPENALWTKSNSFVQQNLLTYSQELDNAAWSKVGATVAGADINATIAPDGTLTADKIAEDATTSVHAIYQGYSAVSGTVYTMSFYAKAAERTWIRTRGEIGINYFNLAAGTVGTTAGGVTATIIAVGNGWYRCIATKAATTTGVTNSQIAPTTADNVDSYAGTAGSGVYVWGAQLVQGSVPGDYRATTSAALPCLYADYNGALRARKLCEDSVLTTHEAKQDVALNAAQYTFAASLKAGERTFAMLYHGNSNSAQVIDLTTGAASGNAGLGAPTSYTITNAGNGWWRVSITVTGVAGTNNFRIYPLSNSTTYNYTGNGSSGIYIADAQLNDGSAATAYWDNATGSATYAPRFDYDPATLAAKGLLVEESRANLCLQSLSMGVAPWSFTDTTVTANSTLSPDGTTNATLFTEGSAGTAVVTQGSMTITAGATVTASFHLKRGNHDWVNILCTDVGAANGFKVWANLATGVIGTTGTNGTGTYTSSSIKNIGNGWYRVSLTGVTSAANTAAYVYCTSASADNSTTRVSGGTRYMYGAQVEAGAFATSYIPTVASQVTRAADVASVNTLSPWFNQAAGTFYAEFDVFSAALGTGTILGDGAAGTSIAYLSASYFLVSYNGTSGPTTSNATAANTIAKASLAYATNSRRAVLNAGTASNQTGDLQVVTKLELGKAFGTVYLNGHLRRVTFYPRQFTAAEQQTLTTL